MFIDNNYTAINERLSLLKEKAEKAINDALRDEVDLHAINFKFFDNLRTYAFVKRKARDNYFAKITSNLKAFLSWCQKRAYIKDMSFNEFKAAEREKDVIYLTKVE